MRTLFSSFTRSPLTYQNMRPSFNEYTVNRNLD